MPYSDGNQPARIRPDNIDRFSQFFEFIVDFPNATGADRIAPVNNNNNF